MGSVLQLNEIKIQCDILFPTCWGPLISKAGKNSRLLFVSIKSRSLKFNCIFSTYHWIGHQLYLHLDVAVSIFYKHIVVIIKKKWSLLEI